MLRPLNLGPRLLRLFAVACCDDIIALLKDERSRHAVRIAELFADGLATEAERQAAYAAAYAAAADVDAAAYAYAYAADAAAYAADAAAYAADAAADAAAYAADAADAAAYAADDADAYADAYAAAARRRKWHIQGRAIVAIVGPGWAFDPAWRTSTAVALARRIYDLKEWDLCPILADALQDAGCEETEVLDYLRGDGQKFRGMRIVDELIGKRV